MNLYLKQRLFSWGDKFSVYDENGNEKYYVEGEVFSWGKKLHLFDLNGNELAFIHQKIFSFLPKYYISKNETVVAEIVKNITFFRQSYAVNGLGWSVEGDFFAHNYEVVDQNKTVARVSKEWFSFGDAYRINISPEYDEVCALSVVLVIDACIEAENNNN